MGRGRFISFEGLDGTGKSTQLARLGAWLRARGELVVEAREPGTTPLGEALRDLMFAPGGVAVAPAAELALMFAARAQLLAEVVQPGLERGAWVLCDRYVDASQAYQGSGRGLGAGRVRALHELLCEGLLPDLTLIFELDPKTRRERTAARRQGEDDARFETEDAAFFERVAAGYDALAEQEPTRCRRIAADTPTDAVAAAVLGALREAFPEAHALA